MIMGSLKGTTDRAIGKIKEAVADIFGDGKLREEAKLDERVGDLEKSQQNDKESGGLNPLGNLDRLT
jgi:uncharacterized protein YjbJ (UPF0337 family)